MSSSSSLFTVGFFVGAAASLTLATLWITRASREEQQQEGKAKSRSLLHPLKFISRSSSSSSSSSSSFLSQILYSLWSNIDTYLSSTIRESIEPMFAQMLPKPLSTLRFTKISLGSNPIRLENVVVHHEEVTVLARQQQGQQQSTKQIVRMALDVDWEADCDIQLKADYIGTLGINAFTFKGKLVFFLHPMEKSPIISAVLFSFANLPEIDMDFTGLAQVADINMIKSRLIKIIQDSLASMIVLPYTMLYKLDTGVSYLDVHASPCGIARITLMNGKGFQTERRLFGKHDVVDVFCTVSLGNKTWRSSTVENHLEPVWNETADFCWNDLEQNIVLSVWDRDKGTLDSDDHLGVAHVTVGEVLKARNQTVQVEVLSAEKHKKTGIIVTLSLEMLSFSEDLSSLQAFAPNRISGLVEIIVLRAFSLPIQKETAASFVKVTCGKHEFTTSTVSDYPGVDALNPMYDCAFMVPIEVREDCSDIVFTLYNSKTVLGSYTVTIEALKQLPDRMLSARQPMEQNGASLEFCVVLRGIQVADDDQPLPSISSPLPASSFPSMMTRSTISTSSKASAAAAAVDNRPQIGTIRVTIIKGYGFKAQARPFRRVDVPDVYCKIRLASSSPWRTATVRNSVNPVWTKESKEFPLYDEGDFVQVDVFDEDGSKLDADDFIGRGRVAIGKLLTATGVRPVDVAIKKDGIGTVAFIALRAERIAEK